ncbi:MAG: SAM-dependent methyltransferase [Pseudomonadota bacterium]
MTLGTLYLIPSPLGESALDTILPEAVRAIAARLDTFVVEHPKTARAFLKQIRTQTPLQQLNLLQLDEHTPETELATLLAPLLSGKDVGLISEAGCPAVADPGSNLVRLAHQKNIRVVPLSGPSSILLSLMASGLSGQHFCFHGYLPVDKAERKKKLQELEQASASRFETEIFIETPYRNRQMLETIVETCGAATALCVAVDVTLATEWIHTKTVAEWKKQLPEIDKRPAVFLLLAPASKKVKAR